MIMINDTLPHQMIQNEEMIIKCTARQYYNKHEKIMIESGQN